MFVRRYWTDACPLLHLTIAQVALHAIAVVRGQASGLRQRIIHREDGQRVLRIGRTGRQAADLSKRLLKRQLPIRVDDIRGVEDPVATPQRYAICRRARPGRAWARSLCNRDRPGCAGSHFVPETPAGRSPDRNWQSGHHARPGDRSIPSAARHSPSGCPSFASRPACNSPCPYTTGVAKTAWSGRYNSKGSREADRPAH